MAYALVMWSLEQTRMCAEAAGALSLNAKACPSEYSSGVTLPSTGRPAAMSQKTQPGHGALLSVRCALPARGCPPSPQNARVIVSLQDISNTYTYKLIVEHDLAYSFTII